MIEVRPFRETDLKEAGEIALFHWGDEAPEIPVPMRSALYEYLVRYYYYPQSPFSFAACENGRLQGMLLAHRKNSGHNSLTESWISTRFRREELSVLRDYTAYLDGNRAKELAAAREEEIIMSFFASRRRGAGKLLYQHFAESCRNAGIPSLVLWTDDTCDHEYYPRHGFTEIGRMKTDPPLGNLNLTTLLFRKQFC